MTGTNFTYTGPSGELRWSYRPAAVLGAWTITANGSGLDLTATVVSHVASRIQQQSMTFRVVRQNGVTWQWPVAADTLRIANGTLTARLTQTE